MKTKPSKLSKRASNTPGNTSAALRYNSNFGNTLSDHIVRAEIGFVF